MTQYRCEKHEHLLTKKRTVCPIDGSAVWKIDADGSKQLLPHGPEKQRKTQPHRDLRKVLEVLRKAASIRVVLAALIVAAIGGWPASLLWEPLAYVVGVPLFILAWLAISLDSDTVLYCPFCSKRVKAGADVCHHCGRDVKPSA